MNKSNTGFPKWSSNPNYKFINDSGELINSTYKCLELICYKTLEGIELSFHVSKN